MPYTINKTNGDVLVTVPDGSVDTTTIDLSLIGKNAPTYGEAQNENFVRLLENFSSGTAPARPLKGQLWYDAGGENRIKVYNGTGWRPISGAIVSTGEPGVTQSVVGDVWMNSNTGQLYVRHSTGWRLVGPVWSVLDNTLGVQVDQVTDSGTDTTKKVLGLYSNGERIGIVSNHTAFTTTITGFSTIGKGITLNSSLSGNKFHGMATEAESVAGFTPGSFMRADVNTATSGTLTVNNNSGLYVGTSNDLHVSVASNDVYIDNDVINSDIYFRTRDSGGLNTILTIDGDGKRVGVKTVSPTVDFEVTGNSKMNGNLVVTGNIQISSALLPTGTSDSRVATTEFVRQEVANLVNSAPSVLDTLNEIAVSLGNKADFLGYVDAQLGSKIGTTGGTMTAPLTLNYTISNNAHAVNKAYVDTAIGAGTSGLSTKKIYDGTVGTTGYAAYEVQSGNLLMIHKNQTIMATDGNGIPTFERPIKIGLSSDGAIFSRGQNYTLSDWPRILVTAGFVNSATQYWAGSAKYVGPSQPPSSQDGDFWFQTES
jgi:hypothetical protein